MLLLSPAREAQTPAPAAVPLLARFLPSLTDIAFVMPLLFLFVKLQGARTMLGDGDTGWHVRAGEWMLENGRVPTADMFSFSRPGEPWFAWEWLWDIAAALLHQRWGMAAVVAASVAVICLSSALLFRLIRRSCENGLVAIAVTLLATGGCSIHWLARPHLFTQLFLLVTLHITVRAREGRTKLLWWLVPLTLLWTNLHGGFFVIFLVFACYFGHGLLSAAIEPDRERRYRSITQLKPWALVAMACLAATFVNPYGWKLHQHVIDYITDPYQMQHIAEFKSMDFHAPVTVYFEPFMVLAMVAAVSDLSRRRFADALLTMGWLHLALLAQRNLPLFAIAAAPSVARVLTMSISAAGRSYLAGWVRQTSAGFLQGSAGCDRIDRIRRTHLVSGAALGAVCTVLLLTPPLPGALKSKTTSTYDPAAYPEKALEVLRSAETSRIFADDEWGDYLIYQLYPSRKVFIDGRSDFYGDKFGERFLDVMNVKYDWQKMLREYDIDTILLAPRFALASTLKISPEWRVVYDDKVALVFRRVSRQQVPVASNEGKGRGLKITNYQQSGRTITKTQTP
jgi:hypothetical protein